MLPRIVQIGPFSINSYGLMMALGFIVTSILLRRDLERKGHNPDLANSITLVAIICGVAGAKALAILEGWDWSPFLRGFILLLGYGMLMTGGFFLARLLLKRVFASYIGAPELTNSLVLTVIIGGVLGAFAFKILLNWEAFLQSPKTLFSGLGSGLTWYGGFILGAVAVVEVILRSKTPLGQVADSLGPLLALGYAFGRMG